MPRELLLIIITAMIAGAIGFGIAVYAVPPEEAIQFRALIDAGLGATSESSRSDNSNAGVIHHDSAQPTGPLEPTREPAAVASPPNETPNRNSATPSLSPTESGDKRQAPAADEPAANITSSPLSAAGSEKALVAPAGHTKKPGKKTKLKNASPSNTGHEENLQ
ncbi:hypothetical protein [Methylocystis sp. B8]|uniref:hypothetical protein n=1 Tax=Methylocystis sp. B8 TaxID=544938 RepID=UPI0010FF461A|nr:hypothetical protein [Methylocystis sp. B8]TLG72622.1 hypothetical protein FEV16_14325 [Methylocystis sp. B8]TLG72638.1 hypothetical protein FEV16_14440 [Methylocystis sp. B8]